MREVEGGSFWWCRLSKVQRKITGRAGTRVGGFFVRRWADVHFSFNDSFGKGR